MPLDGFLFMKNIPFINPFQWMMIWGVPPPFQNVRKLPVNWRLAKLLLIGDLSSNFEDDLRPLGQCGMIDHSELVCD